MAICYSKTTDDLSSIVTVIVNLDPVWKQSGFVNLDLAALGIDPEQPFEATDLLTGETYAWQGWHNYFELSPEAGRHTSFVYTRSIREARQRDRSAVVPGRDHLLVWHVRAFADSNDDGIGDLPGLIQKLDYLQDLGVTCLWLLPFFPSPLKDDGYDISDYLNVHPMYGTMEDLRPFSPPRMIAACR